MVKLYGFCFHILSICAIPHREFTDSLISSDTDWGLNSMGRVIVKLTRGMGKPTYGLSLLFHFCILQMIKNWRWKWPGKELARLLM